MIGSLAPELGGPSNIVPLAEAQAQLGHTVQVYTGDLGNRGTLLPWRKSTLRVGARPDSPTASVSYFATNWPSRWCFSPSMWRALSANVSKFDIVHVHSLYLFHGLAASWHCRRQGVPYIVRPHGSLDRYHRSRHRLRKRAYWKLIEGQNIARATAIHVTSSLEGNQVAELNLGVPIVECPLGLDLSGFADLPPRGTMRSGHESWQHSQLMLFVGRLTPKKGLSLLIETLAELSGTHPDLQLLIAGADDENYGDLLRRHATSLGMGDRVHFLGFVTGHRKVALLRDADVWILPSKDENFSFAAVEALAAGAPVVLSDAVGIAHEVARHGAGLVVPADVRSLATAVESILNDGVLRREIADRGRQLAFSRFSAASAAIRLVDLYGLLLRARGGAS